MSVQPLHRPATAFTDAGPDASALVHDLVLRAATGSPTGHFMITDLGTLARQMRNGFTVLAHVGGAVAGALHVHFPSDGAGYAHTIDDPHRSEHVADVDTAVALPEFRGLGLMRQMLRQAELCVHREHPERVAWYATVHPNNEASRRSFEREGYVPAA